MSKIILDRPSWWRPGIPLPHLYAGKVYTGSGALNSGGKVTVTMDEVAWAPPWLFLDDERNPEDVTWLTLHQGYYEIVRSEEEFKSYILRRGIPRVLSFDNDLGTGGEGRECAKWLCESIMDGKIKFNPKMEFTVHSKNNVAAEWITQYLNAFMESYASK